MKKIKKEFASLTRKIEWKLSLGFLKKKMDPNLKSIFFSLIPTCSLRFPIAATRGKAIEDICLICKLKTAEVSRVKSYIKTVNAF